jgi:hypothetical protein
MSQKKNRVTKREQFTPAEQRAARSERIEVREAEPYGWIAYSEHDTAHSYHLFRDPHTRRLVCTCADFIFRGEAERHYECKHVSAALKFIARTYLANEYDPQRQIQRAA